MALRNSLVPSLSGRSAGEHYCLTSVSSTSVASSTVRTVVSLRNSYGPCERSYVPTFEGLRSRVEVGTPSQSTRILDRLRDRKGCGRTNSWGRVCASLSVLTSRVNSNERKYDTDAPSVAGSRAGCFVVSAPVAAWPGNSWGSRRASSRVYHLLSVAIQAHRDHRDNIVAHFGVRKSSPKKSLQCYADREETESEPAPEDSDSSCCADASEPGDSTPATGVKEEAVSSDSGGQVFETYGPGKRGNELVALASVTVAVGLFLSGRIAGGGPGLPELASSAISYQEALTNGRPTVVEFYADWCEVCKETAHDVYEIEQEYKDQINFVMLNVDNSKWEGELDEFGVEGIPHFAFLDRQGNEEGNIVGRLPRKILKENLAALARGDPTVPHTRVVGQFSSADSKQAPPTVGPRSHSQMS